MRELAVQKTFRRQRTNTNTDARISTAALTLATRILRFIFNIVSQTLHDVYRKQEAQYLGERGRDGHDRRPRRRYQSPVANEDAVARKRRSIAVSRRNVVVRRKRFHSLISQLNFPPPARCTVATTQYLPFPPSHPSPSPFHTQGERQPPTNPPSGCMLSGFQEMETQAGGLSYNG